jgi:hypothetical protein
LTSPRGDSLGCATHKAAAPQALIHGRHGAVQVDLRNAKGGSADCLLHPVAGGTGRPYLRFAARRPAWGRSGRGGPIIARGEPLVKVAQRLLL